MKALKVLIATLLAIGVIALSFGAGFALSQHLASDNLSPQLRLIEEAWNIVSEDFVDSGAIDPEELSRGAISGMLESLGDPYSSYLDAEQYNEMLSSLTGRFDGIGVVITIEDDKLVVVAPIKGTPAEEAGIVAGDEIVQIDGEATLDMGLAEVATRLRGQRGTTVRLGVLHQGEAALVEMEIVREEIELESVYFEMLPDNIAYIQISYFSERTSSELRSILADLGDVDGIVLDLRNNPGGIVFDGAMGVVSQFLEDGVVFYELDASGEWVEYRGTEGGLATDLPLAVLLNGGSASSSEILAGALQDHHRAPLIGTQTAGKGSLNHLHRLSNGSAVYITFAHWLTPDGHLIEGEGLTPDFEVEITAEDIEEGNDPQLERAIQYLKTGE